MEDIKIIFLDVDGVLNGMETKRLTANGFTFVDDFRIERLKKIIDATDAKVVLSSDWRYDTDDSDYIELEMELAKYGIAIYGFTPILEAKYFLKYDRGDEIRQWLKDTPDNVVAWVAIDDRSDFIIDDNHFVNTRWWKGLEEDDVERAINILMGISVEPIFKEVNCDEDSV